MGNMRREFTPEFKDEAVKFVINTGRPVAVLARELGMVEQTLGNWVKDYRVRHETGDEVLTEVERVELLRLRREVSELKMDRAFLKKRRSRSPGSPPSMASPGRWVTPVCAGIVRWPNHSSPR